MTGVLLLIDLFFAYYFLKMYQESGQKLYQIGGFIFLGYVAVILWRSSNTFETSLIKGWLS